MFHHLSYRQWSHWQGSSVQPFLWSIGAWYTGYFFNLWEDSNIQPHKVLDCCSCLCCKVFLRAPSAHSPKLPFERPERYSSMPHAVSSEPYSPLLDILPTLLLGLVCSDWLPICIVCILSHFMRKWVGGGVQGRNCRRWDFSCVLLFTVVPCGLNPTYTSLVIGVVFLAMEAHSSSKVRMGYNMCWLPLVLPASFSHLSALSCVSVAFFWYSPGIHDLPISGQASNAGRVVLVVPVCMEITVISQEDDWAVRVSPQCIPIAWKMQ